MIAVFTRFFIKCAVNYLTSRETHTKMSVKAMKKQRKQGELGMSVSKIWSMVSGMERERRQTGGEEFTYQYLGKIAKELDAAIGYSENGGRGEWKLPPEGTAERLAHYKKTGEELRNAMPSAPAGEIEIEVKDSNGMALVAEIKLFAVAEGVTEQSFTYADFCPDFVRAYTEENGRFSAKIEAGSYLLEVSKGSEYSIVKKIVEIKKEEKTGVQVALCRFVNLTEAGWYVGDLHHHSVYSSPLYPPQGTDYVFDTAQEVMMSMRAKGLTFGALSDHHNVFNHREWEKMKTEDFLPLLSKEISTSNGHILSLNVDPDVIYRIPKQEDRTEEYLRNEFIRTTNEIRENGGYPQVNHPRDMQKAISFPPEFTDIIEIFDTMEIWNGSHPLADGTTNDDAFRLWLSLLEEGRFFAATTGSDTHDIRLVTWMNSFGYVIGLYQEVKKQYAALSAENKEKADYFFGMLEPQLETMQIWLKTNLTSGCVRTYVHAPGERTPENLLDNNKAGHSFITNGPVLLAEIGGKSMGETADFPVEAEEITAHLTILSNRPLNTLAIWQNDGRVEELPLPEVEAENGCYDYSGDVTFSAKNAKWVFFRVQADYTVQALTNPIFLEAV